MRRVSVFTLVFLTVGGFLCNTGFARTGTDRPNFVVVMVDDLGFSDFGCYGSEIETPHIDRLAANGLRFTQFYNTAKCHSSRICLLTGLYTFQAGNSAMDKAVTFAEVLREAGYFTAMAGKWHLKQEPTDRGFMRYWGHLSGATNFFTGDNTFRYNGEKWSDFKEGFYTTDANVDYAIQFIDEAIATGKPFLQYIAFNAPHYPLQAKKKDVLKYDGRYDTGWDAIRKQRFARQQKMGLFSSDVRLSDRPDYVPAWSKLTDGEKQWDADRMEAFAAMVDSVDQNMGRLIAHLKAKNVFDNTLILICSDNGACPFERTRGKEYKPWDPKSYWCYDPGWAHVGNTPFRWYKQNQHEGGIASPLIAHWPEGLKAKAGSITKQPGHLIDISATLADIAGARYPTTYAGRDITPLQGKSLLPVLQGKQRQPHDWLYFQFSNNRAIRKGDWKLVSARGGKWELYNLADDRNELNDLSAKHPQRVKELQALWHHAATEVDGAPKNLRKPAGHSLQTFPAGSMTKRQAGPKTGKSSSGKQKGKKSKSR